MFHIDALPAFADNYIWLLQDDQSRRCAVVDPGDAAPVQAWLEAHAGWTLEAILTTHHHADHVGGVAALKTTTGARVFGPSRESIPALDQPLADGQRIEVLGLGFEVIEVPGHTLGHIAYLHADARQPWLFCGDTLFAAGCGRVLEGTPQQMLDSLGRLAALPDATQVYCAHEYTLSNLRFAQAVEPENPQVAARLAQVGAWREAGRISLPSAMSLERQTNPFLRCGEAGVERTLDQRCGAQARTRCESFAALRSWKNSF
jgi:hydroxyacylglutathione hydrolase